MPATQLRAGRGGFSRARDHPPVRPMRGPVLAAAEDGELGNPLSVPERPIGYGQPDGDSEPLRITSISVCPVVALQAVLDDGTVIDLAGELADFVPFARQVLAMEAAMPQAAPVYEEPYEEPQSQAG